MAGIYLHIPFCKQACHYCDFHFSTSVKYKAEMVQALCRELELRKDYLSGEQIRTIYFGGGTPSLLSGKELNSIFSTIFRNYAVFEDAEITLEANPDDLTAQKLQELRDAGVNRLSIGLQSFHEPHLRLMNRAHSATESRRCVELAQQAGFSNITVDLIYGVPHGNHDVWQQDLAQVFALGVPHVSCYALTVEPNTAFGRWSTKGRFTPATDEFAAEQFEILLQQMQQQGYVQYEISNFCQPGHESKHNSSYWRGTTYLGIGPSAHSFNGTSRQHNIANNAKYLKALAQNQVPAELEELTVQDRVNEYVLTTLRTIWGCDLQKVKELGIDLANEHDAYLQELQQKNLLRRENNIIYLTEKGKLLADQIALDLFVV
ncbi:MAG: radical SAM family heme chaperone HemW [Hymenobacteraceae bacterium]|nr:radical SAM family heme chaperone HemW [Hymenobacteraceae bacterium]MDX5397495.1 radical SAM family heme chaperone HemW [Hymenobacteraceae bacterium]MDX5513571.1 radical SAM family heme chaperone HemW [Hymenobacteraceae bacterium]